MDNEQRQLTIRNEVMSIMQERSMDNGYAPVRVGCNTFLKEMGAYSIGVVIDEIKLAVDRLVADGYLIRNGKHTVDITAAIYPFIRHPDDMLSVAGHTIKGDAHAIDSPCELEQEAADEEESPVNAATDHSRIAIALQETKTKLTPVPDLNTKLAVLDKLTLILDPSISQVLSDVADYLRGRG